MKPEIQRPARDGETLSGPPFDEDELSAIARDYSATVVANLVASYRALRAELDQAREWAQSAELARAKSSAEADQLRAEVAGLRADKKRLDDISRPGASTRVVMRALENMADPKTAAVAFVKVPMGPNSFIESERPTLREAIDSACGHESVREYREALDAARAASGEDASNQQTGRARSEESDHG